MISAEQKIGQPGIEPEPYRWQWCIYNWSIDVVKYAKLTISTVLCGISPNLLACSHCHRRVCLLVMVSSSFAGIDTLAERSKAVDSSSSIFGCVGSKPTGVISYCSGTYKPDIHLHLKLIGKKLVRTCSPSHRAYGKTHALRRQPVTAAAPCTSS